MDRIHKMYAERGFPIEVLIEYVTLFQKGDATIEARRDLLIEQRNQLTEKMENMQKTLERLNYKIERYEQAIVPIEDELQKTEG